MTILYPELSENSRGTLSGLVTMVFVLGQMAGPFFANWIPPKPILITFTFGGVAFLAAVAANPLNLNLTLGLLITGDLLIGMADGIGLPMTTFPIRSQDELGTAGGLSGSIRLTGSSVAVAMYSTILSNRLSKTVPAVVTPAVLGAGLPEDSIPALLINLANNTALSNSKVPGINKDILVVAQQAFKLANSQAYSTVFLSTLGFGGLAMIICWFTGGVDESTGNYVATHIHDPKDREKLENE